MWDVKQKATNKLTDTDHNHGYQGRGWWKEGEEIKGEKYMTEGD